MAHLPAAGRTLGPSHPLWTPFSTWDVRTEYQLKVPFSMRDARAQLPSLNPLHSTGLTALGPLWEHLASCCGLELPGCEAYIHTDTHTHILSGPSSVQLCRYTTSSTFPEQSPLLFSELSSPAALLLQAAPAARPQASPPWSSLCKH